MSRFSPSDATAFLGRLSVGDLTVQEAYSGVSDVLARDHPAADYVYGALRDLTWRILTTSDFNRDLGEWLGVHRHAGALVDDAGFVGKAEQIGTLAELLEQSARFLEQQPVEEVLKRKHVSQILMLLDAAAGAVRRVDLAEVTGLADSNLSRVFAILANHGLVRREADGREAVFVITEAGRAAVHDSHSDSRPPRPSDFMRLIDHLPVAIGLWRPDGSWAYSNGAWAAHLAYIGVKDVRVSLKAWEKALRDAQRGEIFPFDDSLWLSRTHDGGQLICSRNTLQDASILVTVRRPASGGIFEETVRANDAIERLVRTDGDRPLVDKIKVLREQPLAPGR